MGKKKAKKETKQDLDIKKDVVQDPNILKQELEVLIKNLNKEKNLLEAFVLKDDEVSDVDDGDLSGDDAIEDIIEDGSLETKEDKEPKETKKKKEKKDKKSKVENEAKDPEPSETNPEDKADKKKKKKDKKKANEAKTEKPKDEKQEEARGPKRKRDENLADYGFLKDHPNVQRSQILVKSSLAGSKWYEISKVNEIDEEADLETNDYWITKIVAYAEKLLENEVSNHAKLSKNDSEKQWLNTVLKSGVLTDKISAYSVLLQENPVQNLASLDTLISLINLKSRRPCMMSLDAMQGLLKDYLLPPDRKLKTFKEQPLKKLTQLSSGNKDTRDKYLILWLFESKLKEAYNKFLAQLQEVSKDAIEKTRIKVMSILLELLINSPEQEQELLSRIVNKLGDPVRAVAAKAIHQISKLLQAHPAMTEIVMEEIEHLLYRPNVSAKAQYYGICCLTQLILDASKPEMATRLIKVYFSFFKASVKKGEADSKMVSALLTGVNRAYPFAKANLEKLDEHKETLYRLIHISTNFNVSLHALMLLYQVQGGEEAEDRYYSAFYKKLLDVSGLSGMNKHAQFFNLVFKVLKNDPNASRMIAMTKRLLQVALYQQTHLLCAVLYLVSELMKSRKNDANLLQNVLESSVSNAQIFQDDNDDDMDDDYKVDIDTSDDEESSKANVKPSTSGASSSWVHKKVQNSVQNQKSLNKTRYDPDQRNPAFAGADKTNNWELSLTASHFHPSVALFAGKILNETDIKYAGDPLQDFTLMRFLDRFVFRNPKKEVKAGSGNTLFNKRKQYKAQGIKGLAPDSNEYLSKDLDQIPIEERFIYKYLKAKRALKTEEVDSDAESVNSEDFNAALSQVEQEEIDFASNINEIKKDESEDENEDEVSDDEDADLDEEDNWESLGEDDDDEEQLETEDFDDQDELEKEDFDDEDDGDDDFDEAEVEPPSKKTKKSSGKAKKSGNDLQSLLASADEFSAMIDENTQAGMSTDTLGAIFNKDKSHAKQMKWESKRMNSSKRSGGGGKKRRK